MTRDEPDLPGLYEPVIVERTDSARAHAERLAAEGANEGTVIWARKQTEGIARKGRFWVSGDNNLHCAVILRPEDSYEACCQLGPLAAVCACQAITLVGEPMEELKLRWPDDVYLNRGKVAAAGVSGALGADDRVDWMVVSVNINTVSSPVGLGFDAASLKEEGFEVYDRITLLEGFAREFLNWLNRWSEQGFEPIRKVWQWRGDWGSEARGIEVGGRELRGSFESMDVDGALKLQSPQGIIPIELGQFYRPDFESSN